jgi:phosphoinositide-3-kinase, regulatory subunit 4
MGNTASVGPSVVGALDSYVSELGDSVVYEKRFVRFSLSVLSG